ncbi:MAG: acyl carrier protein [Nodosilinea sp.]
MISANHASARQISHAIQRTPDEIQEWIITYLEKLLDIDPEDLDTTIPFDRYGLDSLAAVGMTGELEDWLGQQVDPTLLYDYPTVEALAEYLGTPK